MKVYKEKKKIYFLIIKSTTCGFRETWNEEEKKMMQIRKEKKFWLWVTVQGKREKEYFVVSGKQVFPQCTRRMSRDSVAQEMTLRWTQKKKEKKKKINLFIFVTSMTSLHDCVSCKPLVEDEGARDTKKKKYIKGILKIIICNYCFKRKNFNEREELYFVFKR